MPIRGSSQTLTGNKTTVSRRGSLSLEDWHQSRGGANTETSKKTGHANLGISVVCGSLRSCELWSMPMGKHNSPRWRLRPGGLGRKPYRSLAIQTKVCEPRNHQAARSTHLAGDATGRNCADDCTNTQKTSDCTLPCCADHVFSTLELSKPALVRWHVELKRHKLGSRWQMLSYAPDHYPPSFPNQRSLLRVTGTGIVPKLSCRFEA